MISPALFWPSATPSSREPETSRIIPERKTRVDRNSPGERSSGAAPSSEQKRARALRLRVRRMYRVNPKP